MLVEAENKFFDVHVSDLLLDDGDGFTDDLKLVEADEVCVCLCLCLCLCVRVCTATRTSRDGGGVRMFVRVCT